jgi:hypothetical protein
MQIFSRYLISILLIRSYRETLTNDTHAPSGWNIIILLDNDQQEICYCFGKKSIMLKTTETLDSSESDEKRAYGASQVLYSQEWEFSVYEGRLPSPSDR